VPASRPYYSPYSQPTPFRSLVVQDTRPRGPLSDQQGSISLLQSASQIEDIDSGEEGAAIEPQDYRNLFADEVPESEIINMVADLTLEEQTFEQQLNDALQNDGEEFINPSPSAASTQGPTQPRTPSNLPSRSQTPVSTGSRDIRTMFQPRSDKRPRRSTAESDVTIGQQSRGSDQEPDGDAQDLGSRTGVTQDSIPRAGDAVELDAGARSRRPEPGTTPDPTAGTDRSPDAAEVQEPPIPTHIYLIRQLRSCNGCSLEAHNRSARQHYTLHRSQDVSSHCHSIADITATLQNKVTTFRAYQGLGDLPRRDNTFGDRLSDQTGPDLRSIASSNSPDMVTSRHQNHTVNRSGQYVMSGALPAIDLDVSSGRTSPDLESVVMPSDRATPGPAAPGPEPNTLLPDHTSPEPGSPVDGTAASTEEQPVLSQPIGPPLPDVVNSGRMGLRTYPEGLNCQQAFEGTTSSDVPPPRLCLSSYYGQTTADQAKCLESFDIDSICGLARSLSFAKEGISWFPEMNTNLNVTANIHFGIPVPPPLDAPTEASWEAAPLSRIPHYAFGQVKGWSSIFVYFVFPRLYRHPAQADQRPGRGRARQATGQDKLEQTLLSRDQYYLWYDAVLLPAIFDAVKVYNSTGQLVTDSNIIQHLPRSRLAASQIATARAESLQSGFSAPEGQEVDPEMAPTNGSRKGDNEADPKGRQMISHVLDRKHLGRLTEALRERIRTNPECQPLFDDFVIYFACKNIKVDFMASGSADQPYDVGLNLMAMAETFFTRWVSHIDMEHTIADQVFVDLAKQVTAADTALPYDQLPDGFKAETFLWRNCCLDSIAASRRRWAQSSIPGRPRKQTKAPGHMPSDQDGGNSKTGSMPAGGSHARGRPPALGRGGVPDEEAGGKGPVPLITFYPWAMTGEAGGITITSAPNSTERKEGLLYSQYYNLIKAPFDANKNYVLQAPGYENIAIDPLYLRQLKQEGRGPSITNQASMQKAYLRSKARAATSLRESRNVSFGIREEHRITFALFRLIMDDWFTVDLDQDDSNTQALPYFAVESSEVFDFLQAQINRHCLLFEFIKSKVGLMYSLPETVAMVIALRGLRFCYSSNLIQREQLLFGDQWTQEEYVPAGIQQEDVEEASGRSDGNATSGLRRRERLGLGMYHSIDVHGFGWWKPGRFQWLYWRFKPYMTRRLLVGNLLLHEEYRRRWRAVKEMRDVHVQVFQADQWFSELFVARDPEKTKWWLDYLTCLVISQFDLDIWAKVHHENIQHEELTAETLQSYPKHKPPVFCWDSMCRMFKVNIAPLRNPCPPHFTVGNRMVEKDPELIIRLLFEWRDVAQRHGWSAMKYRAATQRIHSIITQRLGPDQADTWFEDLKKAVLLTHWILPYPSTSSIFSYSKEHKRKNQSRRMMWFSTVYTNLELEGMSQVLARTVQGIERDFDTTGQYLDWRGKPLPVVVTQKYLVSCIREVLGADQREGGLFTLSQVCGVAEQLLRQKEVPGQFWAGRLQDSWSTSGKLIPFAEAGKPPQLKLMEEVRGKTIDELDQWFRNLVGPADEEGFPAPG